MPANENAEVQAGWSSRAARSVWSYMPGAPAYLKKSWNIAKPYFTRENAVEIGAVLVANVGVPIATGMITNALAATGESDESGQGQLDARTVAVAMVPIIGMSVRYGANWFLASSVSNAVRKDSSEKYLADTTMLTTDLLEGQESRSSFPYVMTQSIPTFADTVGPLTIGMVGNGIDLATNFVVSANVIGSYQTALYSLAISTSMGAATVYVRWKANKASIENLESEERLRGIVDHLHANPEQICILNGQNAEHEGIGSKLAKINQLKYPIGRTNVAGVMIGHISYVAVPMLLNNMGSLLYSAEQMKNPGNIAIFAAQSLYAAVTIDEMVTPISEKYQLDNSIEKITGLSEAIEASHAYLQHPLLKINYSTGDVIEFSKFSLTKPAEVRAQSELMNLGEGVEGALSSVVVEAVPEVKAGRPDLTRQVQDALKDDASCTLREADLTLEPGKVYKLDGESGAGKSILFKAMVHAWPYAAGTINFPFSKQEIYFIPQKIFTPHKASLLEVMIYPGKSPDVTQIEKIKLRELMGKLRLEKLLPMLELQDDDHKKNWSQHLSPGQQQRVAVIRALMSRVKPRLVLMDESTASVDEGNKNMIQALIREWLPDATIIYIDHAPIKVTSDNALDSRLPTPPAAHNLGMHGEMLTSYVMKIQQEEAGTPREGGFQALVARRPSAAFCEGIVSINANKKFVLSNAIGPSVQAAQR